MKMVKVKSYSLNIEKGKQKKYQVLSERETPDAPFATMKDVFLASAALGFVKNKRIPLRNSLKIFEWDRFVTDPIDEKFISALTLATNKDINVILDRHVIIKTVEEYANGGFDELYEAVTKRGNKVLNLVDYVLSKFGKEQE